MGRPKRTGVRAVVFVPARASGSKFALLRDLGSRGPRGRRRPRRGEGPRACVRGRGRPALLRGRAEPAQFAGYAEIGREIVEQLGERPALTVVPVGNGALLIGVARGLGGGAVGVVAAAAP